MDDGTLGEPGAKKGKKRIKTRGCEKKEQDREGKKRSASLLSETNERHKTTQCVELCVCVCVCVCTV